MSTSLRDQIEELLENTQVVSRHSFFQLKHFVIGKEPTIQAKLRRCLLEMESRKESLNGYEASIEEASDDICLADLEIRKIEENPCSNPIDKEIAALHVRKLKRKRDGLMKAINNMEGKLTECEEECALFFAQYQSLLDIEQIKPYDDLESNVEYWNAKFLEDMNLRLMFQKPLDLELIRAIRQLPPEAPVKQEMENIIGQIKRKALGEQAQDCMLEDQLKSAGQVETINKIELANKETDD